MKKNCKHVGMIPAASGSMSGIDKPAKNCGNSFVMILRNHILFWLLLCILLNSACQTAGTCDHSCFRLPGGSAEIEMVRIRAGTFQRYSADGNAHAAAIPRDYFLGKYEVTQGQFEAVMGYNPSKCRIGINNPVTGVSWYEAKKFCRRLNVMYKNRLPDGCRFDLPSVVQWEYACCAGTDMKTQSQYYNDNPQIAGWTYFNSPEEVQPAGLKMPNPWGLHDMHGNAAELCRDLDELVLYKSDLEGKDAEEYVTVCGWGIFHDQYDLAKLSVDIAAKDDREFHTGFRLALIPVKNVDIPDYDDSIPCE